MKLNIHQTHQTIADFKEIFSYLVQSYEKSSATQKQPILHVFPELFLTGYPLQDLCLQDSFVEKYLEMLSEINKWSKGLESNDQDCFLIGGLEYENYSSKRQDYKIRNVIYKLIPGQELKAIYTKQLLPNYDIFDERKYFWTGSNPGYFTWKDHCIALLICEDMWPSTFYDKDPAEELLLELKAKKHSADILVNLSASPFALGKFDSRLKRGRELSSLFKCPFVYVNRVGVEDEIIFDGSSFYISETDKAYQECKSFVSELKSIELPDPNEKALGKYNSSPEHVWQNLFKAQLDLSTTPAQLFKLSNEELEMVVESLKFSLQEYAQKNGFKKFLIALSGGMDSALVLTIARLSLKEGQSIEAVYMPSQYSVTMSYDLSLELCKNLGVDFKNFPIKFLHSASKNHFSQYFKDDLEGTADENIQSRLRGAILYGRSNQTGAMVINTSNKSEIAVGYSTQYGDSVGAISLLGDLYKSEVYQVAEYINKKYKSIIPEQIITRPPSAELRADQEDSHSLPPYDILDAILEAILSYQYSKKEILELGFNEKDIDLAFRLYKYSEFKRFQFCPITKIKMKSFGFGYRLPISKNSDIYS